MAVDSWYEGFIEEGPMANIVVRDPVSGNLVISGSTANIFGIASFTLAKLPHASLVRVGSVVNIPKSEFSNNTGIPEDGIYLKSDGYNWVTAYPGQIFSMQDGTPSAPLILNFSPGAVTKTMFTGLPGGNPTIPWQLMHLGMRLKISATFRFGSSGNFNAQFQACFGKSNNAATPLCGNANTTYAADKCPEIISSVYVNSNTSYIRQSILSAASSAVPADGYPILNGSSLDWSAYGNHYVNFAVDPSDSATGSYTYDLINYKVELIS